VAGKGETITEIGRVTHYFDRPHAAVVKITSGELTVGDTIRIKGHTTDFSERVESLQVDHRPVERARTGDEVGLAVRERAREHDIVYRVTTAACPAFVSSRVFPEGPAPSPGPSGFFTRRRRHRSPSLDRGESMATLRVAASCGAPPSGRHRRAPGDPSRRGAATCPSGS
jgi:putative protease